MSEKIMNGKVLEVSEDGNLIVQYRDSRKIKVSSKYCSVPAKRYIGNFYTFKPEDIICEIVELPSNAS